MARKVKVGWHLSMPGDPDVGIPSYVGAIVAVENGFAVVRDDQGNDEEVSLGCISSDRILKKI